MDRGSSSRCQFFPTERKTAERIDRWKRQLPKLEKAGKGTKVGRAQKNCSGTRHHCSSWKTGAVLKRQAEKERRKISCLKMNERIEINMFVHRMDK